MMWLDLYCFGWVPAGRLAQEDRAVSARRKRSEVYRYSSEMYRYSPNRTVIRGWIVP